MLLEFLNKNRKNNNKTIFWNRKLGAFIWNRTGAYIAIRKSNFIHENLRIYLIDFFLSTYTVMCSPGHFRVLLNLAIVNWVLFLRFPNFCYYTLFPRNNLQLLLTFLEIHSPSLGLKQTGLSEESFLLRESQQIILP